MAVALSAFDNLTPVLTDAPINVFVTNQQIPLWVEAPENVLCEILFQLSLHDLYKPPFNITDLTFS